MTGVRVAVAWPTTPNDDKKQPEYKKLKDDYTIHAIIPTDELDEAYRPWLEKQVGYKGLAWDWEIATEKDHGDQLLGRLYLRFRKGKEKLATMAVLKWS
jgi:hypothetical protein